jgi:hypothetical protein
MGRARKDRTAVIRSERYRATKAAEGWRTKTFLLPPDVVASLGALAASDATPEVQVICRLVRRAMDEESV